MSDPRDHSVDRRARLHGSAGDARPRDPTESLHADSEEDEDFDPLSSSQAPLGTRDAPRSNEATRIESPAALRRTPHPPTPAQIGSDRKPRASKPPPSKRGPSEKPEERIGEVLGSYRLLELLGRGGMGFVYKSEHVKLGRTVALKLLRSDYAKRRDSVARFFQEARTVNRVRHRNIVDVTDFVELDDGTTFIIMELLEGQSLGKWARAGFSVPRALALLIQICDGLAAAHAVGVIHRDLKPDNVIVVPTGDGAEQVKLLDFGVAKLLNRDDEDIGLETQAGSVIGTPAYMSPEQAGGLTVDTRADTYSLGAIMYELFCGQPMFKGRSFGEYVRKHLNEIPVPPRQTPGGAAIDDRLEAVILRCIQKDPAARYATLAELRDELLHLLGGIETQTGFVRDLGDTGSLSSRDILPISGRRSTPPPASVRTPPAELPAAIATPTPRRWPWIAGALALAGGVAVVLGIALSGDDPTPTKRPPPAPAPQPEIVPLAAGSATPRPLVDITFDSEPGGDVYEIDAPTPRCSTPCSVAIDPETGETRYVIRRDGYEDELVTIDLDSPPKIVSVTLKRREAASPDRKPEPKPVTVEPKPDPVPDKKTDPPPEPKPEPKPDPKIEKKPPGKIGPGKTKDPFAEPK